MAGGMRENEVRGGFGERGGGRSRRSLDIMSVTDMQND